jgi:hypothetical protein
MVDWISTGQKNVKRPANCAPKIFQPHIFLLVHLDYIQPGFNQIFQNGEYIAAAVQECQHSGGVGGLKMR